jgi:hypothetical protein
MPEQEWNDRDREKWHREVFIPELKRGHAWQERMGEYLGRWSLPVRVDPLVVSPTYKDRMKYLDRGDIWVDRFRIEQKTVTLPHRNIVESLPDELPLSPDGKPGGPFPGGYLFVENTAKWRRKLEKGVRPAFILSVSEPGKKWPTPAMTDEELEGRTMVIPGWSQPWWFRYRVRARNEMSRPEEMWIAPGDVMHGLRLLVAVLARQLGARLIV